MSSWVEKRGERWRARHRFPDGTKVSRTFATKKEAQDWADEQGVDYRRGEWVDERNGDMLFSAWSEVFWAEHAVNLRPSTLAAQHARHKSLLMPMFGGASIGEIEQLDVQKWVAKVSPHYKASYVHSTYTLFGKIMTAAVDAGLIRASPCRKITLPRADDNEMRFLEAAQVWKLAETIDARYRAMILAAGFGGLRVGELAALRAKRLDVKRCTIAVEEIAVEVKGQLLYGPPKTRAGRRLTLVPRSAMDVLAEHVETYGRGPDDFIFEGARGGTLRANAWRARVFGPAVATAKLGPLRPHDLRHTAVSIWISAGWPAKEIAVRAGHASVSSVLDRYGHLLPSNEQVSLDSLNEVSKPVPEE